jgi:hypothetical protein
MRKTFSVPSSVGYAQNYYVLRTEAGRREWVDCWRGLLGIDDGRGGVTWFRHLEGQYFAMVEHDQELTEEMLRCLPPDHGSREANAFVEMIVNYTDAAHPQYNPQFHADVVAENPSYWRPIARA